MPAPLTVRCPACDASLKLKSREAVGRRVACPKCRRPFVVEDPADADDFSALDEFDSFEDTSFGDEDTGDDSDEFGNEGRSSAARPRRTGGLSRGGAGPARRSQRSSAGGSRKRKARRGDNRLPLYLGAGALGLALLLGLAFTVGGLLRGGGPAAADIRDLSYLPPESDLVVSIRAGDILNSPWKDQLLQPQQQQALTMLKTQTDFDFMEIDTISIAVSGLKLGPEAMGPAAAMHFNPMFNQEIGFLIVLRSRSDFPMARIRRESRSLRHKGETYYMDRTAQGPFPAAMYLPNARTMVVGLQRHVQAAIDRGPRPPAFEQFAFADFTQHVGFAFAPRDRSFLETIEAPDVPGFPVVKTLAEVARRALGVGLDLNYGADAAVLHVRLRCGNPQDAEQLKAVLDELLPQGRAMLDMARGLADPQQAQGMQIATQVLEQLTIAQNGETVTARASLTRETAAQLQKLGTLHSAF